MVNLPFELKGKTVYVAGHRGMVGSALVRRLAREGVELLTASRSEADLRAFVEDVKASGFVAQAISRNAVRFSSLKKCCAAASARSPR